MSGRIPGKWIDDLFQKIGPSGSFEKLNIFAKDLTAEGFSLTQYILQLHEKVVFDETIPDSKKAAICEKLAVAEGRLHDGANEYLQILDVTTLIMNQMTKSAWIKIFLYFLRLEILNYSLYWSFDEKIWIAVFFHE